MRCLRPNDEQELALAMTSSFLWLDVCLHCAQKPLVFDDPSMLRQCRYSGLLEAVQSCDDNFVQSKSIRGDKAQAIKQPFCPCVAPDVDFANHHFYSSRFSAMPGNWSDSDS